MDAVSGRIAVSGCVKDRQRPVLLKLMVQVVDAFDPPRVDLIEENPGLLLNQEVMPLSTGMVEPLAVVVDHAGKEVDLVGGPLVLLASLAGETVEAAGVFWCSPCQWARRSRASSRSCWRPAITCSARCSWSLTSGGRWSRTAW